VSSKVVVCRCSSVRSKNRSLNFAITANRAVLNIVVRHSIGAKRVSLSVGHVLRSVRGRQHIQVICLSAKTGQEVMLLCAFLPLKGAFFVEHMLCREGRSLCNMSLLRISKRSITYSTD